MRHIQFGTSMPIYRREESIQSVKWTAAVGHGNLTRTVAAATYLRR